MLHGSVSRLALSTWLAFGLGASTIISTPAQAAELEKVIYLLPSIPSLPAFAPWMLAKQKGYFKDEGLEVEFQTAQGGVEVAKQVGLGNAPIGGAIGDTPIIVRANGIPVKAVAVLGNGSLMQLVTNEDSPYKEPKDLKGKKISVMAYQDTTFYSLLGMLASAGLTKNDVEAQAAGPANVWKLFMSGDVDAMAAVPDWIGLVQASGKKVNIIPSGKYFPSMAQAIIASDKIIQEKPELVKKLVKATLKGMKDIMDDPEKATADYIAAVPEHKGKEATITNTFKLYNEYVYGKPEQLGAMDPERLEKVQKFYLDQDIIKKASDVKDLYSNDFIK